MILDEVDPETRDLLERYGFDAERFEALRTRVADGSLSAAGNALTGVVEPVTSDDLTLLSAPGEPGYARMRDVGLEALERGEVSALVLAGGMATRFGGVVKANVEAVDGRSFLDAKLDGIERLGAAVGVDIPVAVMTSFQTDAPIREALAGRGGREPHVFSQFVSLRLEPDGSLFRGSDGRVSPYGPGHGDLLEAIQVVGDARRATGAWCPARRRLERRQPRRTDRSGGGRSARAGGCATHGRGRREGRGSRWGAGTRRRSGDGRRRPPVPAGLRSGVDPRLQHQHGHVHAGCAGGRLRPDLDGRRAERRESRRDPARAGLPRGVRVRPRRRCSWCRDRGRAGASIRSRRPRTSSRRDRRCASCCRSRRWPDPPPRDDSAPRLRDVVVRAVCYSENRCSVCCFPFAARSVSGSVLRSAGRVSTRSYGSGRPVVRGAARRGRGRSDAAPSASDAGSPSAGRGRRWSTTGAPVRSSRRGRSVGAATLRTSPARS